MFWLDNPQILFDKDNILDFFPTPKEDFDDKLNSIMRLSVYMGILLAFYHKNMIWLSIIVFTGLFTIVLKRGKVEKKTTQDVSKDGSQSTTEQFDDEIENNNNNKTNNVCTRPTLDNPFMNPTMKDYLNVDPETNRIVDRPPACDISDPIVKQEMDKNFDNNLYKDIDDVFGKMNSQRQFYTMPSTTIPNDQDGFAKWLYLSPKTCKEDQDYCLRYEDIRAKRFEFPEPERNPVVTKT